MKRVIIEVTRGDDDENGLMSMWAWKEIDGSAMNLPENESSLLGVIHGLGRKDLESKLPVFARLLLDRLCWVIE